MSNPNIYIPSHTKKGPLHARDIEKARMPCFLDLDYPEGGTRTTIRSIPTTRDKYKYLTKYPTRRPLPRNLRPLLRRHEPRIHLPPPTLQAPLPQAMHRQMALYKRWELSVLPADVLSPAQAVGDF